MEKEVALGNALDGGNLAYAINPAGAAPAKTTEKAASTAEFIMSGGIVNGYETIVNNQVADGDWFSGNWSELLIGMWGGVDILVDPHTHSRRGRLRITCFQTVDVGVRHAESFCYSNDGV